MTQSPTDNAASQSCVAGVYASFDEVEHGIRALLNADYDPEQISLIMLARTGAGQPVDVELLSKDLALETAQGSGLGGVLGFLGGVAITLLSGIGTVWLLGPIAGLISGAALGAMAGWGVHKEHIHHYENCVKQGKALLIAHGTAEDLQKARNILEHTQAVELRDHP